jgi:hypothetical protein
VNATVGWHQQKWILHAAKMFAGPWACVRRLFTAPDEKVLSWILTDPKWKDANEICCCRGCKNLSFFSERAQARRRGGGGATLAKCCQEQGE